MDDHFSHCSSSSTSTQAIVKNPALITGATTPLSPGASKWPIRAHSRRRGWGTCHLEATHAPLHSQLSGIIEPYLQAAPGEPFLVSYLFCSGPCSGPSHFFSSVIKCPWGSASFLRHAKTYFSYHQLYSPQAVVIVDHSHHPHSPHLALLSPCKCAICYPSATRYGGLAVNNDRHSHGIHT